MRSLERPRQRVLAAQPVGGPVVVEALLGPGADDDLDLLREELEPLLAVEEREARARRARARTSPTPIPTSTRPPEMWSTVTAMRASTLGCRKVAGETSVPRRIRS